MTCRARSLSPTRAARESHCPSPCDVSQRCSEGGQGLDHIATEVVEIFDQELGEPPRHVPGIEPDDRVQQDIHAEPVFAEFYDGAPISWTFRGFPQSRSYSISRRRSGKIAQESVAIFQEALEVRSREPADGDRRLLPHSRRAGDSKVFRLTRTTVARCGSVGRQMASSASSICRSTCRLSPADGQALGALDDDHHAGQARGPQREPQAGQPGVTGVELGGPVPALQIADQRPYVEAAPGLTLCRHTARWGSCAARSLSTVSTNFAFPNPAGPVTCTTPGG